MLKLTLCIIPLLTVGCMQDTRSADKKLAEISDELKGLKQDIAKVKQGGGAGAKRGGPQPGRPDPTKVYSVPVHPDNPIKGAKSAPVTVVKAFEFACGYCKRAAPTMDQIVKAYGDKVRVVYKHSVIHPAKATYPALASCAAGRQGKFDKFEHLVWEKAFPKSLNEETMDGFAKEIGLNMDKYKTDINGACKKLIGEDRQSVAKFGARGTPAFFVNGRFINGAQPFENFKKVIDQELAKYQKSGAKNPDQYYAENVVKKGLKKL